MGNELGKQLVSGGEKILVQWQIMRRQADTAGKHRQYFRSFLPWKCVEFLNESSRTLRPATSVP